ncbi:AMP-dependent synthetase [Nocardiopsis sp. TSRI0078]|uniref:AMP-binding protein n=1 Tax=unclassified Nocardiopsis TaxID=2649073 RepID=UPI000938E5D6|nr:AMP-binding protein [Nocardiopsis sp. TSRI0078]OKI12412.1 AMP-dependent synthetase [Nocardiopsis sp. TSRI0078]
MPVPDPAHHVRDWLATYDTPTTSVAHLLCDRHTPHTTATTEIGPTLAATTLTFGELTERSRALAAGLADLGITTGDRVATLIPKGTDLTVTALAAWRLGAVLVPLLSSLAPSAITERLTDSHARLIVCDAEYRTKLDPGPHTTPSPTPHIVTTGTHPLREGDHTLTGLTEHGATLPPVTDTAVGGDGLLAIVYVSSVIGPPRGVRVPVRALAAMHAYHHYGLGVDDDDVYWNTADPGSAYGLYHGLISPLLAGHGSLALRAGFFDPELTLDVLGIHGVTNLAADPTTYRTLRAATKTLPPEVMVQRLASAGEPLAPDVIDWATDIFGVPVHDHYGQTELGWCVGIPNGDTGQDTSPPPGAIGPALPGWRVEVLEAISDDPAPPGTYGRIAVDLEHSPLAWFDGYVGHEGASQVRFTPDHAYYLTGDTGIRDREGSLFFSTRDDGAILTYGYRIGPTEVESALNAHPAVEECGVYSIPDELAGQVIGARVVLAPGREATPELAEELKEWVRARIAEHAAPRVVDFVDELPRTASGKMRRARLR